MRCQDTDSTEAIHINTGALELAQKIQQMTDCVVDSNADGNGEIIFKLKVFGGKISRNLNFAGTWFPRKQKRER